MSPPSVVAAFRIFHPHHLFGHVWLADWLGHSLTLEWHFIHYPVMHHLLMGKGKFMSLPPYKIKIKTPFFLLMLSLIRLQTLWSY